MSATRHAIYLSQEPCTIGSGNSVQRAGENHSSGIRQLSQASKLTIRHSSIAPASAFGSTAVASHAGSTLGYGSVQSMDTQLFS